MPITARPIESARAYSVAEVAEMMRKPRGYVYNLIHAGKLRHLDLGSIRVPHEFLLDFYRNAEGKDLRNPLSDDEMEDHHESRTN